MPTLIPTNILMGLLAAFFWGGGDFSGGMGAKFAGGTVRGALRVILVSHSTSLSVLLTAALLSEFLHPGVTFPHGLALIYGLAAGVTGGLSLVCFYIALARGAMGAAAALSGLVAAAIPATFSLFTDGSPGGHRIVGFLVAGIAIWMVAAAPTGALEEGLASPSASTLVLAILAGAGFGLYFVLLKLAAASVANAHSNVAWTMATARVGSIATCSILLFCLSRKAAHPRTETARLPRAAILWSLSTAVLDTGGNLLFIFATRAGRLDVAAVLASLYPATTILLAGVVLKERLSRRQGVGMGIAALAVVLITV